MKFVYFGTAEFAVPSLARLAPNVSLVIAQPDRPAGRGMKVRRAPVAELADRLGLPVLTPEKARVPEFVDRVREERADALIVAAYGQILSQKLLDSAKFGGINLHGSILPAYRGAAPIQRAILDGQMKTGVTLMQMDKGMDTGDVIEIREMPIEPDETYGELAARLAELAAEAIGDWAPRIATGDFPRTPQNHDLATYAPKIEKAEAALRWEATAETEYNRWRAFEPSPGAYLRTTHGTLRIGKLARVELRPEDRAAAPGCILSLDPLTLAFGDGALAFLELQPEGKKRMSGKDWANGMRLKKGERLTSIGL